MSTNTNTPSPFDVVHHASNNVRNHYLEGQPFQQNYPGPFGAQLAQFQRDPPIAAFPSNAHQTPLLQQQIHNHPQIAAVNRNITPPGIACSTYNSYMNDGKENFEPTIADSPTESLSGNNFSDFKDPYLTNPASQTGFGNITPVFLDSTDHNAGGAKCTATDNALLDLKNRPIDQFARNNMVPNYGAKLTQNMEATGVPQAGDNNTCHGIGHIGNAGVTPYRSKLELFTGTDEMYMHKREAGPLFSPAEQQTQWPHGMPAFRPDEDRYTTSLYLRNNESPVEKQRVGPGIALDYSVPAAGGFQQFTRILPNNVTDYKANQLENRVNAGKWQISEHPTSQYIHGVRNKQPKQYMTQTRRPTMPTVDALAKVPSADSSRVTNYLPTVFRGKQARPATEGDAGYGELKIRGGTDYCVDYGEAPVGKAMKAPVNMPMQGMLSYEAGLRPTFRRGVWGCKDREQGTDRFDLWQGLKAPVANGTQRDGWYAIYTQRGDQNPYVINVAGTANINGGQWNPNVFNDGMRTTRKETSLWAHTGSNVKPPTNEFTTRLQDLPQTTRKETTEYHYHGNPTAAAKPKSFTNQVEDPLKTTRKETTSFAYGGNLRGNSQAFSDRFMFTGQTVV